MSTRRNEDNLFMHLIEMQGGFCINKQIHSLIAGWCITNSVMQSRAFNEPHVKWTIINNTPSSFTYPPFQQSPKHNDREDWRHLDIFVRASWWDGIRHKPDLPHATLPRVRLWYASFSHRVSTFHYCCCYGYPEPWLNTAELDQAAGHRAMCVFVC